jgi:hypothetical protein
MWTREANDILVDRWGIVVDTIGTIIREPGWRYKSGVGDIGFLEDVLLGKSNPSIIRKRGWEIGLFEIVYLREGQFLESPDEGQPQVFHVRIRLAILRSGENSQNTERSEIRQYGIDLHPEPFRYQL